MQHTRLVDPTSKRPASQFAEAVNLGASRSFFGLFTMAEYALLRDNFKISTWVLIGACLQSILMFYLPGIMGLAPAFLWLGWRIADPLLMMMGVRRNPYMDGLIPGKWAVHFPDKEGKFEGDPSNDEVCLIILSARCNHPLGMFAPGYKALFEVFKANVAALEAEPEENGFLGMSSWLNSGDRSTASEAMMIGYFKNVDYLHKFAHGKAHREGWNWWNKNLDKQPHLSIMHEVYQVPKGSWESIYVNFHPTGLAATSHAVKSKGDMSSPNETTTWFSPIVDAQKGKWRTSAGRMGRTDGGENVKYGDDPYNKV